MDSFLALRWTARSVPDGIQFRESSLNRFSQKRMKNTNFKITKTWLQMAAYQFARFSPVINHNKQIIRCHN